MIAPSGLLAVIASFALPYLRSYMLFVHIALNTCRWLHILEVGNDCCRKMRYLPLLFLMVSIQTSVAVSGEQKLAECKEQSVYGEEYCKYRTEVLKILDADPTYVAGLKTARPNDFLTGRLAYEFVPVVQKAQFKLDIIKRAVLSRLQHIAATEPFSMDVDIMAEYLDLSYKEVFQMKDLEKLFVTMATDIVEGKRREQIEKEELEKKAQEEIKINEDPGFLVVENKSEYENVKESKQEPEDHEHSYPEKQQPDEVRDKKSLERKESRERAPETFFKNHDSNNDGFFDESEIRLKLCNSAAGFVGLDCKKCEELEKMKQKALEKMDLNQDGRVRYALRK
ncbi:PREDICTED: nucleobindin-2-like isoform X2 [Vollenhovia emeryi]|uniref:nucleobindin-2-like isoform X2 n=1 Tax=Vollenhovia emeryi TaxID=411798 RepID=UPI0005F5486C|nr:PREDICTED: nucleobindin-2-like isoform X2 [Vollenhovia emeryi]